MHLHAAVDTGYTYTLGPAGNRTRVVESSGRIVDYTYDDLYRLTQEAITDSVNETISYVYDDFGNRLTKTDSSGTVTYTYDDNDRMITESGPGGNFTYVYDDNGNTLEKNGGGANVLYTYDYENHLIQVDNGTSITAYVYDADGIRVASETDGAQTVFVVDKNRQYAQVLEERDGTGSLTVSYVYGDDLISQQRGINTFHYLYDGQLSTRALSNDAGDITDTYTYDAFGIILDEAGTTQNNYRYTGEQFDPNIGFYYLRARYYDQNTGRFVTTDPYQGRMHEPVTLHKYLYGNGNPVMFNDPGGEMSMMTAMTTISIIGVLTTQLYTNISHNLSKSKAYDWKGVMIIIAYSKGTAGGYMYAILSTQTRDNKRVSGRFALLFPIGIGRGGFGLSASKITLKTPGIFGPDPNILQGPATYIAASKSKKGIGYGSSKLIMGMGKSDGFLGFSRGFLIGSDTGAEMLLGFSIRVQ